MDHLIIFGAKYLIFVIAAAAIICWLMLKRDNKIRLAVTVIIGLIIAVIIAKIASQLYYDPRPFVKSSVEPLFSHPPDNGFPSDHTYLAMTVAACVFFYRRNVGIALGILAVLVGVSRVAAHVHSPIDIIGALIIGVIVGAAGYYLANLALRKHLADKKNFGDGL